MAHLAFPRVFSATSPVRAGTVCPPVARGVRNLRVSLLVVAALAMGVADLLCTLAYMTSIGMVEMNPIARRMIEIGGADQLIMYKLFTMALSSGIIYLIRRSPRAEACAWLSAAVMALLTFHWIQYNRLAPTMTTEFSLIACQAETMGVDGWVSLTN